MSIEPSADATIVSLLPWKIKSEKLTLDPGLFEIPAAPYDGFIVFHVGISRYRPYFGSDYPAIMVPELGQVIANSIVLDYVNSLPAVTAEEKPGMFIERNRLTIEQIKANYKNKLERAREEQNSWFWRLATLADDLFPFQGHKTIMKIQREAAKALGYKTDWNIPDHRTIDALIAEGKVEPVSTLRK